MADTVSEAALKALTSALSAGMPAGAVCERNVALPRRIPAGGQVIVRDGDPGDPEVLFSPTLYVYSHMAQVDVLFEEGDQTARDAGFDALKTAIGEALESDRTLGGVVDHVAAQAPSPLEIVAEGVEAIKAATLKIELTYETSDPLA